MLSLRCQLIGSFVKFRMGIKTYFGALEVKMLHQQGLKSQPLNNYLPLKQSVTVRTGTVASLVCHLYTPTSWQFSFDRHAEMLFRSASGCSPEVFPVPEPSCLLEHFFLQARLNTWPYSTATLFVSSIDNSQITWAVRMGIVGCVVDGRISGLLCHQTSPLHFYLLYRILQMKPCGAWGTVLPSYGLAIKYTESYTCCFRTSSPLLSQYGPFW